MNKITLNNFMFRKVLVTIIEMHWWGNAGNFTCSETNINLI